MNAVANKLVNIFIDQDELLVNKSDDILTKQILIESDDSRGCSDQ